MPNLLTNPNPLDESSFTASRSDSFRRSIVKRVFVAALLAVMFVGASLQPARSQTPGSTPDSQPQTTPPQLTPPVSIEAKPKVIQPDGILILSFSRPITVSAVRIGVVNASFTPSSPTTTVAVKVPSVLGLGKQEVAVTLSGAPNPVSTVVTVSPLMLGLKTHKGATTPELSRVVVTNAQAILQFAEKIPAEIRQSLKVSLVPLGGAGAKELPLTYSIPEDDYLLLEIPNDAVKDQTYAVRVQVDGSSLEKQPRVKIAYGRSMVIWATLIVLILMAVIYALYWFYKRINGQPPRRSFLKMLLLEEENQTYSLSRAQFVAWLIVIVWCYYFLYYAHGFIDGVWSFPNLGNAIYAFLISLGTLVAAQATNNGMGVKGAGEEHPSPADFIVHGGVLALDRIQQVVWTLIALGMFVRITVSTYLTATALPEIPTELLTLMGLSSAGYLGGKLVRGAGPVIDQVTVREGSLIVTIKGKHLSKQAFVWLDGVQMPKDKVTSKADDPDDPTKFATELELTLDMSKTDWLSKNHALTVINDDAQRADWRTSAEIVEVTAGQPARGKVTLTIKTARATRSATVEEVGVAGFVAKQDENDSNLFTAVVDEPWTSKPHQLALRSNGRQSTFSYIPTAAGGGDAGDAGGAGGAGGAGDAGGAGGAGGAGDAGGAGGAGGAGDAGDAGNAGAGETDQ